MVKQRTDIHPLLDRRRDWPLIVTEIDWSLDARRLLELAEENRWKLFSLGNTDGKVPSNVTPHGALVNALPTDPLVVELLKRGIPVVRLGRLPHPDDARVPAVLPDFAARGPLVAEHFAQRRFQHVAYVGRKPLGDMKPMCDAFFARARALGCQCHLIQEDPARLRSQLGPDADLLRARQQAFTRWLERLPKPVGLVTFGDPAAALYCQWLVDAGLRVPEDVAVMGMGDIEFVCKTAAVPLSSVAFDHRGYVEAGVALLARLMAGRRPGRTPVMVPPLGIVTRQSTDVLAASNPDVVKALRFMWDHVDEDLSVDRIARHVGVSRRTLEVRFQRELGVGVNAQFQRRRLQKAGELLVYTELRVARVAEALRYTSHRHFFRLFRGLYGMSPAEYRRRHARSG